MPKSRSKVKKSTLTSAAAIIGVSDDLDLPTCCSNRNCPSHWHDRLTEKLKMHKSQQQSKLKTKSSSILCSKPKTIIRRKLPYANICSKLFNLNINEIKFDDLQQQDKLIYSIPVIKTIVLTKHETFADQIIQTFGSSDDEVTYTLVKTNLQSQLQYRMVPLVSDPFSDQMDRMEASIQLKINILRINHVHLNCRLPLKIVASAIWTSYAVHTVVQDENSHCLRLSIYNWSHVVNTREIKSRSYVRDRLTRLLTINSCIVLLDPWLKCCADGDIALRCESPNTHLLMIDFETRCSTNSRTTVDELREWGNACYQADDNLGAIEFYTFGLRQLDEQQEKELTSKGKSIGPKTDDRQQHRIRLLSNRCACYLRERHSALALADTGMLLSLNEISHVLESPKATAGKLLFRCLSAHLQLGLFDKVDALLNSHKIGIGLAGGENPVSMAILERELARLRGEVSRGRYDLQAMLREQTGTEKPPAIFIDLPHHHVDTHRTDLFEVRLCQEDELAKNGYPAGSYGVYALKNIESGTLIVVEQPFASIDNRVIGEQHSHSYNVWQSNKKNPTIDFCNDDTLRLLNEVEKQLLIGSASWTTFDSLKSMQPIRQWLAEISPSTIENAENSTSTMDTMENDETTLPNLKPWRKCASKKQAPPAPFIPWRILFETQRQNAFRSQSAQGWYPFASMFNHSCLPNCLWYLIGDCLFIYVCASKIHQGDELTISYCPLWISSLHERTEQLHRFNISSCQCILCSYDRANMPSYEKELKKFINIRALARQTNLLRSIRFDYVQQLKDIYERLIKKFKQRPIGFINEFIDLEHISHYFEHDRKENIEDNDDDDDETEYTEQDIEEFLDDRELSFLTRLARACRFSIQDLPKVDNPILLFGTQMQLLVYHLEHCYARVHSCDLKQWNRLLERLYEIFTFNCHSSASDMEKTLKDHEQLFSNLLQTQVFLQQPSIPK